MINQLHCKTADKLSAGLAREGVDKRVPVRGRGGDIKGLHM